VTLPTPPDLDDVLEAFAAEASGDDAILAAYIRRYPQYALALADYAHELRLVESAEDEGVPRDIAWEEESWRRFEGAAASAGLLAEAGITDPFAGVALARLVEIRRALDVPSPVLNGFRDRLVLVASVPTRFLAALADLLNTELDRLKTFLDQPPRASRAASYKADTAPSVTDDKITFEVLLDQAMVPEARRRALLDEQD